MVKAYTDGRLASLRAALRGGRVLFREHNSHIHAVATVVVIGAGAALELSGVEWCAILLATALVWVAEALNTALEKLADAAVPQRHELVGRAKDVAACGVLIAALAALTIAGVVFGPRLLGG